MTLMVAVLTLLASGAPPRSGSVVIAQQVTPAGELRDLAIENAAGARCALGPAEAQRGKQRGFGWVNKLTPPSYPATLRSISIGFERTLVSVSVKPDALYRIVVYIDPEGDGPGNNQQPDATFIGRVRGTDISLMTFNLITPLTIASGSFAVGAIDEFGIAGLPALFFVPGNSTPPGSESFFTGNGGVLWQKLTELSPSGCGPGSLQIRATVELGTVDPLTITRIKDPDAVEPWGVGSLGADVIVTNLVSDNITVINTANNTFRNIAVVDPRVCASCGPPLGPFGVASVASRSKVYVTLFGSNTVPSKEFAVDYTTVQPGRVAVLTRQSNGSYTQSLIAGIGTGPKFPAVAAGKLYVPCGGDNRVDVINTATDLKVASITVGSDPSSCTASLNESKIYVTNFGDGTISVIDTKTDTKIKDIPAPQVQFPAPINAPAPAPANAKNPWSAAVSSTNGNLYVTYWSTTAGDVMPNGALVEFDTCQDAFVRAIIDDTTRGTPPGSAGASGIPAPTSPLTRDPATGRTLQAGGGGGGPFGIAACRPSDLEIQPSTLVFTNDGLGITAVLDSRIDQVITAPPISLAACPKPRGAACVNVPVSTTPVRSGHFAYVACGQPDNSVLVFRVPELSDNIATIPRFTSADLEGPVRLEGAGFDPDIQIEVARPGTSICLTFRKRPKIKKSGKILVQKGGLSDGTSLSDAVNQGATIRIVNPDGSARVLFRLTNVAAP